MEGDLSLSQSFGGLRIANPDDVASGGSDEQSIPTPRLHTAESQKGKEGMWFHCIIIPITRHNLLTVVR